MPMCISSDSDPAAEVVLGLDEDGEDEDEDEDEGEGEEDGMGETAFSVATTLPVFLFFPLRLARGGLIVLYLVSILVR